MPHLNDRPRGPRSYCLTAALTLALTLTGCNSGTSGVTNTPSAPLTYPTIAGRVFGGQNPISGASITMWQVNTNGSAATSMLTNAVTTDTNGNFSLTGDYPKSGTSCTSSTYVYLLATGGNSGNGTNSAISLMAALGKCSALSASTTIQINEVTTIASVFALQNFIGVSEGTAGAEDIAIHYSTSATSTITTQSITGLQNAFALVPTLVNIATGTANYTVGNASIEADKINALANILSYCVNSSGAASNCTTLFSAVTPSGSISPGDTIQAALYIALNPSNNVTAIANLEPTTPPFSHATLSGPYDWSIAIGYTADGMNEPYLLASDSSGNIWIANAGSSGNESLVELTPSGTPATGSPFLSGTNVAFDGPQSIVPDTLGNLWISAHSSSSSIGNRLVSFNPSTSTATTYTNLPSGCLPYALSVDASDNIFFTCPALGYLYELPNLTTGTPSSTNLPTYTSGSPTQLGSLGTLGASTPETYGLAIDTLDNVWAANTVTAATPTVTEYASGSYTATANTFTLGSGPIGIAADHSNNIWAVNGSTLNEYAYSSGSYTANDFTGGGLSTPRYLAIDGTGNIWIANGSPSTLNGTTLVTISEFNSAGQPLTQGVTSTQPGGLAYPTSIASPSPRGLTIDPSGNVWIAGCGSSSSCNSNANPLVVEFVGAAAPPIVPLSTAIAGNQLACCSFTPASPTGTSPTDTAGTITYVIPSAVNSSNNYAFTQDSGTFSFEITRTGGFQGALSIPYSFVDGTAVSTGGSPDYSGGSGTLTWADGDSSVKTLTTTWNHTSTYTGTKTFSIHLTCTTACPASFSPTQNISVTVTDNLKAPSSHFTFNNATINYYLGLPIDQYGGTGGTNGYQFGWQTIADTTLATGFSDPYFYLNSINQIVFTAPSNGATSSPGVGTNDTRSELREQYYGTGAIDGDDWDSSVGGTLNATVEVNATSVDTNEATIGQIHGQNNPFVLLEYQPTSSTQGNIVLGVINTNTNNSGGSDYTIATGVSLNTFFTYQLKLSGSSLYAYVNGSSLVTMPITVDSSWLGTCGGSGCTYDDGMYFKFGAYSGAPNTGNPAGDETQVTFSSFSVTHP